MHAASGSGTGLELKFACSTLTWTDTLHGARHFPILGRHLAVFRHKLAYLAYVKLLHDWGGSCTCQGVQHRCVYPAQVYIPHMTSEYSNPLTFKNFLKEAYIQTMWWFPLYIDWTLNDSRIQLLYTELPCMSTAAPPSYKTSVVWIGYCPRLRQTCPIFIHFWGQTQGGKHHIDWMLSGARKCGKVSRLVIL